MSPVDLVLYSEAAFVVCLVTGRNCRLKTALYQNTFSTEKRILYALVCKTLKFYRLLSETVRFAGFWNSEPVHLSSISESTNSCLHCLLVVLAHDALLGTNRSKHSTITKQIYKATGDRKAISKLRRAFATTRVVSTDVDLNKTQKDSPISLPCYARVNFFHTNLSKVQEQLLLDGFEEIPYDPSVTSYKRFKKKIRNLKENQYLLDYHLPRNLLVFRCGSVLQKLRLYQLRHLLIQDKASCIPPMIVRLGGVGDVIDACAAPGNKTLQLAEMLPNGSTLFALERDPKRFTLLCNNLRSSGVVGLSVSGLSDYFSVTDVGKQPTVVAVCTDFLAVDPNDPKFANVKAILLDPSCSGSGLYGRNPDSNIIQSRSSSDSVDPDLIDEDFSNRLQRLSNFQAKLLRHALSFPAVEQVVYSTCSIFKEENELVVRENVDRVSPYFFLEPIWATLGSEKPFWLHRGFTEFDCESCLRASPEQDLTNGFFIASFARASDDHEHTDDQRSSLKRPSTSQYKSTIRKKRRKNRT